MVEDLDINTEKLILLIKDHPTFYDKSSPPLDQNEKQNLWFNICKELVPDWEKRPQLEKTQIGIKVYSRWKNLRTSFRREYELQKEETKAHRHGNPFIQKKRKKYEFFDQLLFLLPTVAVQKNPSKSNSPQESVPLKRKMTSRAVSPIVFEDNPMSASVRIPGINLPSIQISRVDPGQADQPIALGPISHPIAPGHPAPHIAPGHPAPHIAPGHPAPHIAPGHPAPHIAPGQATQPVPPCQVAQQNLPRPTVDEDRHFLLSVLPALQRMSRSQKLKVKMKFLQAISDVDAETRETLQRYICFARPASDQDYNLPEPFTGGVPVRPFVMQADHTYYLVRDKGNKRARMRPESADTDPHQQFETGHDQDYAVCNNLPEAAEDTKSHESIEIGHPQESAEDAKSDESVEFGSLQQTADIGNLQENLEEENVQETVEVGGSQEPVEVGSPQEPAEVGGSQEQVGVVEKSVAVGNVQKTVEVKDSKDTVEVGGSKDTVEVGGSKNTVEVGGSTVEDGSQGNIKVGNLQVPAEVGNLEDNVEVFTTQENVESSGEPMDIAVVTDEFMLEAV